MRKWVVVLGFVILAIVSYNYIYQDHRNIQNESPEFILTSNSISLEFSNNFSKAEKKYLNKTIEIEGVITELDSNTLTLNNKVFCQFTKSQNINIKNNTSINIKGRFIGYDDLLEQIKLDQCIINQFK